MTGAGVTQALDPWSRRRDEIMAAETDAVRRHTDRVFSVLMLLQWAGGILLAIFVSPRTWIGDTAEVHLHVWASFLLGGVITMLPVFLAVKHPGRSATRYTIAVAQMCWSALLIHVTGGRIETHFHVFGSLAFLAFYRDWRVLVVASTVIAADHLVRGIWWPASVFGVFVESPFRWLEHAAWVVFEDIFLFVSCRRTIALSRENAVRCEQLEFHTEQVEGAVRERTRELEDKNRCLEDEIAERERAEAENRTLHDEVVRMSREAGRSEIATNVLHNVGNVLNSVNVSTQVAVDRVLNSRMDAVASLAGLLRDNSDGLGAFFETETGRHVLPYLDSLSRTLTGDKSVLLQELQSLRNNVEHVKDIVQTQQSYTKTYGVRGPVTLADVIDDALRIVNDSFQRHHVTVVRGYDHAPVVVTDRHKLLEILVNLLSNAKHAVAGAGDDKTIVIGASCGDGGVTITVADSGVGIAAEHLTEIFRHGFTTRPDGHGFGLHACALAAKDLGGSIRVHSDGPGRGARFTVELPDTSTEGEPCRHRNGRTVASS